jgi:hypothetical protein
MDAGIIKTTDYNKAFDVIERALYPTGTRDDHAAAQARVARVTHEVLRAIGAFRSGASVTHR